jgi:hypothetical protein
MLTKTVAPLGDHRPPDTQPLGDLDVLRALGRGQHDPRPLRQRLRTRRSTRPRLKLRPFVTAQLDLNSTIGSHDHHPDPAPQQPN